MAYHRDQIGLAKELWEKLEAHFDKPGTRYQKLRQVFQYGLSQYSMAASNVPKFVGGIYHQRDHIGDPGDRLPFAPVPAEKQREALALLMTEFFSADAFEFSAELLNKLAPERFWDFGISVWGVRRIDYPLHEAILSLQRRPLDHLYDATLLCRLLDIELRYPSGQDTFSMAELFATLRQAIWSETESGSNTTSLRRALQRVHLSKLLHLVLHPDGGMPLDACSLARADLKQLKKQIGQCLKQDHLNAYTRAHLDEVRTQIKAALKANVERRLV